MGKQLVTLIATLSATALVAAGCGGGDDNSSDSSGASGNNSNAAESTSSTSSTTTTSAASGGGGGSKLALAADPSGALKFDKTQLNAKSGKVTIDLTNSSQTPHAVEVEGNGVEKASKTITGGSSSVTVDLKPGKYEFYCPVPGHKQAGMKGTLTVS
jgi:uncharacterized cupredoxin-like copper-binding protein